MFTVQMGNCDLENMERGENFAKDLKYSFKLIINLHSNNKHNILHKYVVSFIFAGLKGSIRQVM